MRRGLRADSAPQPTPSLSMTPGRKLSTTTSARSAMRRHAARRRPCGLLREREELLELGGEHRVAGDLELALEVELHADLGVAEHGHEVLVRDLDGALGLAGVAVGAGRRLGGEIDGPVAAA